MSAATLNNIPESIAERIGSWVPIVQISGDEFTLFGWKRDFGLGRNGQFDFYRRISFLLPEPESTSVLEQETFVEKASETFLPWLEVWFFAIWNKLYTQYQIDLICGQL